MDGEFGLIRLEKRINRKPLPEIIIADMRREVRRGNNSAFSSPLRAELEKCLSSGNQAILFLNRRGYSQTVICKECGYVAKCEACDVSLTYHRDEDCLKCHYCGARYKVPVACPECGGTKLSYAGTGTQRIVADLSRLYPSARILRMDNDTTSGKEGHYKILKAFGERQADILVGNTRSRVGHDFPSVTLVGILDADMSLHFSDTAAGREPSSSSRRWRDGAAGRKKKAKWCCRRSAPKTMSCAMPWRTITRGFTATKFPCARRRCSRPFPKSSGCW